MAALLDEWALEYTRELNAKLNGWDGDRKVYKAAKVAAMQKANLLVPEIGRAIERWTNRLHLAPRTIVKGRSVTLAMHPSTPEEHLAHQALVRAAWICSKRVRQLKKELHKEVTPPEGRGGKQTARSIYLRLSEKFPVIAPDEHLAAITGYVESSFKDARRRCTALGYAYERTHPRRIGLDGRAAFWKVVKRPEPEPVPAPVPVAEAKSESDDMVLLAVKKWGRTPDYWQGVFDTINKNVVPVQQ